jgi:hypothetical protein
MLYSTWSFLGTSFRTQRRQRAYKDVSSVSDNNFTCTSSLMSLNDNIYENLSCCNSLLQILLCMEYTDHASSFTINGTYFAILHSDNNVVCHDSLPTTNITMDRCRSSRDNCSHYWKHLHTFQYPSQPARGITSWTVLTSQSFDQWLETYRQPFAPRCYRCCYYFSPLLLLCKLLLRNSCSRHCCKVLRTL